MTAVSGEPFAEVDGLHHAGNGDDWNTSSSIPLQLLLVFQVIVSFGFNDKSRFLVLAEDNYIEFTLVLTNLQVDIIPFFREQSEDASLDFNFGGFVRVFDVGSTSIGIEESSLHGQLRVELFYPFLSPLLLLAFFPLLVALSVCLMSLFTKDFVARLAHGIMDARVFGDLLNLTTPAYLPVTVKNLEGCVDMHSVPAFGKEKGTQLDQNQSWTQRAPQYFIPLELRCVAFSFPAHRHDTL